MDIAQAIELIDVSKEIYGFNIDDRSKEELCSQIAAVVLGPNLEKGPKTIDVIGSTSAVAAFVFTMEREHQLKNGPRWRGEGGVWILSLLFIFRNSIR